MVAEITSSEAARARSQRIRQRARLLRRRVQRARVIAFFGQLQVRAILRGARMALAPAY